MCSCAALQLFLIGPANDVRKSASGKLNALMILYDAKGGYNKALSLSLGQEGKLTRSTKRVDYEA